MTINSQFNLESTQIVTMAMLTQIQPIKSVRMTLLQNLKTEKPSDFENLFRIKTKKVYCTIMEV